MKMIVPVIVKEGGLELWGQSPKAKCFGCFLLGIMKAPFICIEVLPDGRIIQASDEVDDMCLRVFISFYFIFGRV